MKSKELQAEIIRLYEVENWAIGTIASQMRVHHTTVRRIISKDPSHKRRRYYKEDNERKTDRFIPFIKETLEKYPGITATRLHNMLTQRGYEGSISLLRYILSKTRGSRHQEPYLRLKTLSGEQAQVDWAHFGSIKCGNTTRPLMAFVMVLSHSRALYLHYCLSQSLSNFLQGHELAFKWFGGVPRVCLYDNLKSVVLERIGQKIRFNEQFVDFATHYRFEPRPVGVARGNEKGRVERAIRYIRDNFFAARHFEDVADLNAQALKWSNEVSLDRAWQEDPTQTIREAFDREKSSLLPIPNNPYPCEERREVVIGKTPYARFDLNTYSVPHDRVRKTVTVYASINTVRIVDANVEIANHPRSYERNKQIENFAHIQKLVEYKAAATEHRGVRYLYSVAPITEQLLQMIVERGFPLRRVPSQLIALMRDYGEQEFNKACKEALEQHSPHPNSIRHILERNRQDAGRTLPSPIQISSDPRVSSITVTPHKLDSYDNLLFINVTNNNEDTHEHNH